MVIKPKIYQNIFLIIEKLITNKIKMVNKNLEIIKENLAVNKTKKLNLIKKLEKHSYKDDRKDQ